MKKALFIMLMLALLVGGFFIISPTKSINPAYTTTIAPTVKINGETIVFKSEPIIVEGVTMIELESIFDKLGVELLYDDKDKTIIGKRGRDTVSLQVDSKNAQVNGEPITLYGPVYLKDKKVFIPISFLDNLMVDQVKHTTSEIVIRDFSLPGSDKFDTDKDTLSDYQEINKYFTDPDLADTDGDGKLDSDWDERSEYTYTIKTNSTVLLPGNILELNNNVQDGRIIKEYGDRVDVEAVIYPYTTYDSNEYANSNWKSDYSSNPELQQYLQPTPQLNWDEQFRTDLLNDLSKDGIYPDKLTDLELVKQVSQWLNNRQKYIYGYSSMAVEVKDGKMYFPPDAKKFYLNVLNTYPDPKLKDVKAFIESEKKKGYDINKILDEMPLGKESYYKHIVGECTEHAILWGTVYRALGIPTTVTVVLPILSQGSKTQQNLISRNIQNKSIKSTIEASFAPQDGAVSSHYFNEVYVGNKWISLDGTLVNKNTNTALSPSIQYARTTDPIYFDYYNNWFLLAFDKIKSVSPGGVPYKLNNIKDEYGVHIKERSIYNQLFAADNYEVNKDKFKNIAVMALTNNLENAVRYRIPVQYFSYDASVFSQENLNKYDVIIILDDSTQTAFSNELKPLFEPLDKGSKNFLNVSIKDNKLLVYLKAEKRANLVKFFSQVDIRNYWIEQYVDFDKAEKPII